jgi:hypothetical protein
MVKGLSQRQRGFNTSRGEKGNKQESGRMKIRFQERCKQSSTQGNLLSFLLSCCNSKNLECSPYRVSALIFFRKLIAIMRHQT